MQVHQVRLTPSSALPGALQASQNPAPDLVLCFADPLFFEAPDAALTAALRAAYPESLIVGCSSAGEISTDGVTTGSAVVTSVKFARPGLVAVDEAVHGMTDSEAAGERLGAKLASAAPHSVIVLGQGVELNGSALIRGLRKALGERVTLVGGLAGDAGRFVKTHVISGARSSSHELVAVGFTDPALRVTTGTFGGWKPFGALRRVTRASGNVLHELDGEPALNVYKRYLGEYAAQLPGSALLFPFAMFDADGRDTGVIRTILGADEAAGSLTLAGEIAPDGFLRLMTASSDELINGAEVAAESTVGDELSPQQTLALLVSCVGRRMVLGARVEEEVEAVADVVGAQCTLSGFYSNGEISSDGGLENCKGAAGHHLHNQTMTITRFAEG
jgi:hypothetical protein